MSTLTLGDLNFRVFKSDSSSKNGCPVSTKIQMADYLASKTCSDNNRIVPLSGQQVVAELQHRIQAALGTDKQWGDMHVYRDHLRFDGYVEKHTAYTTEMPLLSVDTPISDLVFERAIGTIDLFPEANGIAYRMAFRYEPKLLEVAIGPNVTICNNFNIFGGKRWTASRSMPFEAMIVMFEEMLKNIEEHYNMDMRTIKMLQDTPISYGEVTEIIGDMSLLYHDKMILPITTITDMCREVRKENKAGKMLNYWDLTNAGTQVLKFENSSGEDTLETIDRFNNYVVSRAEDSHNTVVVSPTPQAVI